MQDSPTSSAFPSVTHVLMALVSFFGIIASSILTAFFMRRKNAADIGKTNADTHKIEAETRQIDSSIITNAFKRLEELEAVCRGQSLEITTLKQNILSLEFEARSKQHLLDEVIAQNKLLDEQNQRARAAGLLMVDRPPGSTNPAAKPIEKSSDG